MTSHLKYGLACFVLACLTAISFTQIADAQQRNVFFTKTVDLASQADGVGSTTVVTATGARLGDICVASLAVDVVDMTITCNIQAAGLAEVRVQNESGSAADLAETTMRVVLIKTPQF